MNYKILLNKINIYKIITVAIAGLVTGLIYSYIIPARVVVRGTVAYYVNESVYIQLDHFKNLIESSRFADQLAEDLDDPELPNRFNPNLGGRLNVTIDKGSSLLFIEISEDFSKKSELEVLKIISKLIILHEDKKSELIKYILDALDQKNNSHSNSIDNILNYFFFKLEEYTDKVEKKELIHKIQISQAPYMNSLSIISGSALTRSIRLGFIFSILFLISGVWFILILNFKTDQKN
jgi:hypothetical protein